MNTMEIAFRHIPMAISFVYKEKEYIKTNFGRGYYWKDGKKVFRYFKKGIIVKTNSEYFDVRG